METTLNKPVFLDHSYSIKSLFKDVFQTEISDALLDWKYNNHRGFNIGFFNELGHLVGHVGGVYRDVFHKNELLTIPQMVDLMVSPSKPGGLSRNGSVFRQLMTYYMDNLKTLSNPQSITFGFPSDRAMRAGEKLAVFKSVDRIYALTFTPQKRTFIINHCTELSHHNSKKLIDSLWEKMYESFKNCTIGIRNYHYLNYRYFNHPEQKYLCYLISTPFLKKPVGIAFLKVFDDHVELMDIICDKKDIPTILKTLQQQPIIRERKKMLLWLTSKYSEQFSSYAFQSEETQFRILANPFYCEALNNDWWLTSGDTEYR